MSRTTSRQGFITTSFGQWLLYAAAIVLVATAATPTGALSSRDSGIGEQDTHGAVPTLRKSNQPAQNSAPSFFSFSKSIPPAPTQQLSSRGATGVRFSLTTSGLLLQSPSGVRTGTVRLFDLSGRLLLSTTFSNLAPGVHSVARLPQEGLVQQAVLVNALVDEQEHTLFLATAAAAGARQGAPAAKTSAKANTLPAKSSPVIR
jgi:hypothetical protein